MTRSNDKEENEAEARAQQCVDRLLIEAQVAARQGRSLETLCNQRVTGDGIPILKLGRSVRCRLADVLAWENARRRHSTIDQA